MVKIQYIYNDEGELIGWQEFPLRKDMTVVELTDEEFKQLKDNLEKGIYKAIEPKK